MRIPHTLNLIGIADHSIARLFRIDPTELGSESKAGQGESGD